MTESKENKELKEKNSKDKYSKDKYFAIIYLKGGCSNGNTEINLEDRSAWMYYIEFISTKKNIQVTDRSLEHYVLEATTMKSQNRMTLEVMKEAMKEAINSKINKNKLLFVTDYRNLAKGINCWKRNWKINNYKTSDNKFIVDKELWKKIIKTYEKHFPQSKVLLITKKNKKYFPQFIDGMQKVTEYVNGKTKFNK